MGIAVIDTLRRGESGLGTFAVADQDDLKLGYVSVTDIVQRDAIPEWKRTPYMTVRVISTNEEYTLGINTTIAGQVWTLKGELPSDIVLEGDIFDMSGFIKSELIQNITLGASYVVPDETAQLALTTLTGNFVIRTDTGDVYVKLNDTNPALIGDFALVTYPGAVTSVNSMTGNVIISIANLLADGTNLTNFQQAVDDSPAVDALQVSVGANTTAIGINATAITNNFNTLQAQITPNTAQIAVNTADILALQLASAGGYTVVEAEGIALQAQDTINVLNGLTAVDDDPNTRTNFKLGGPLSEHTTIDGVTSYNVTFTNLSDFVLDLEAGAEFTITGGSLITAPATTAYSSFNIPHGVAPTAPNDGDIWTTSTSAYVRINGVTQDLLAGGGGWAVTGTTVLTGDTVIDNDQNYLTFSDVKGVNWTQGTHAGVENAFVVTGGTTTTAGGEQIDVYMNLSRDVQFNTGTISLQRSVYISPPTYSFVGASTITDAYVLYINGPAIEGTNATITNNWAAGFFGPVRIQGGDTISRILQVKNSSNVERFYVNGYGQSIITASTPTISDVAIQVTADNSNTSGAARIADFLRTSSGTPTNGIAGQLGLYVEGNSTFGYGEMRVTNENVTNGYSTLDFRVRHSSGDTVGLAIKGNGGLEVEVFGPLKLDSSTVAGVPTASNHTGSLLYITDETGGAVPAFSDGTNWRRVTDRAVIA